MVAALIFSSCPRTAGLTRLAASPNAPVLVFFSMFVTVGPMTAAKYLPLGRPAPGQGHVQLPAGVGP